MTIAALAFASCLGNNNSKHQGEESMGNIHANQADVIENSTSRIPKTTAVTKRDTVDTMDETPDWINSPSPSQTSIASSYTSVWSWESSLTSISFDTVTELSDMSELSRIYYTPCNSEQEDEECDPSD